MKKIILLFILISLFIFPGSIMAQVTKVVKKNQIPILISETKYKKTDVIDTKTINKYKDNTDKLISSILYDNSGEIIEQTAVTYKGNEAIYATSDKNGELLRSKKIISNSNGVILETIFYDFKGKQASKSVFKYNNDFSEKTKWEVYNSENELLSYNTYVYVNGKNTRSESYSSKGGMEEYFLFSYDKNGNMTESGHFDKSGKKISGTVFEYKNNVLVSEKIYKGEKTLLNEMSYDYSEKDGKKVERKTVKAPDSTIIEIIEKEFSFITQ